jgi:hypothetical protein
MARPKTLDKSLYVCYSCGSDKTNTNSKAVPNWFLNLPTLFVLCYRCYCHLIKEANRPSGYQRHCWERQLKFKGKRLLFGSKLRSGICSECGKTTVTALHHTQYDETNPLAHTIELCRSCHLKESWRLGQCRFSERLRDPSSGRFIAFS